MKAMRVQRSMAGILAVVSVAIAVPLLASPGVAATGDTPYSDTKKLQRIYQTASGDGGAPTDTVFNEGESDEATNTVTVKVDKTQQLRGRERVRITWSGAHPTGGRSASPYGEKGMDQEYPVVILQCRGREGDARNPLSPETCWTATRQQRSQVDVNSSREMVWRADAHTALDERTTRLTGMSPMPLATCGLKDQDDYATHLTPFRAAKTVTFPKGKTYEACSSETMPPEAAVDATFPAAEQAAFTDLTGRGEAYFEARSNVENESLGCSDKVACSIVVIPIMGISCAPRDPANPGWRTGCMAANTYEPGQSFDGRTPNPAVTPRFWWSPSNWENRFTVPITFGPPPNVCDLLDDRSPVGFYGSELMSQAGLQWAPAYCLDQTRFKFQANKLPDDAAFSLLGNGGAAAAFIARERESLSGPVGYAPTAITGFAVGYVIDRPDNRGEFKELRLTPRLIAKLLSTSYPAVLDGRKHPGMKKNPLQINLDPEFKALNPGADDMETQAAAALMSLSVSSDVMWRLTEYLDRDAEARAFLDGNPDPWGMQVNPSYKGIDLPVGDWPLNDSWRMEFNDDRECEKANTTPFFTQIAAPVASLRHIAEALLDGAPFVQTKTDRVLDVSGSWTCKYGRIDRLGVGQRFMVGIVDLGDAERFGLRTAALQTSATNSGAKFTNASGRTFAAPDLTGLANALAAYTSAGESVPFAFDPAKIPTNGYPGTVVVYTAAKLTGMDLTQAKNVASFIRIATTEGQVQGAGNGQLPDGYLPLVNSGATAALWEQAQTVADLIEEQKEPEAPEPDETDEPKASATPTAAAAAAGDDKSTPQAGPITTVLETDPSAVTTSKIAALLLPLLILGAAMCMLATPVLRMMLAQGNTHGDDQ